MSRLHATTSFSNRNAQVDHTVFASYCISVVKQRAVHVSCCHTSHRLSPRVQACSIANSVHSGLTRRADPTVCLHTAVNAQAGEVLTSTELVFDSYDEDLFEPSYDLRELAAAQLRSTFQVLARISPDCAASIRTCVYARRADSLESSQIRLQRVACWPRKTMHPGAWDAAQAAAAAAAAAWGGQFSSSSSESSSGFEDMDDLLVLQRPSWEPGSSSTGNAGCDTEASLCQEEIVVLPSSKMLVLPLAESSVLVGLLVVQMPDDSVLWHQSSLQQQPQQWGAAEVAAGAPRDPSSSSNSSDHSIMQAPAASLPTQQTSGIIALPDDVLWCLRMAVPPLAKGCAMDVRAALAGAQQQAKQRLAQSLLLEARGPLKVLGTFGQMLAPRLRASSSTEPESDMADGMVMQGQRLADVVAALEAALRPNARGRGRGRPADKRQLALLSATLAEHDHPEVTKPRMLPVQQQLQEEPTTMAVNMNLKQLPGSAGVVAAALINPVAAGDAAEARQECSQQHQQQQQVVQLPGVVTAASLEASRRAIRWSNPTTQPQAVSTGSSKQLGESSSSNGRHSNSPTSSNGRPHSATCYSPAAGSLNAQQTIDLEPADAPEQPAQSVPGTANTAIATAVQSARQASSSSNGSSSRVQGAAAAPVARASSQSQGSCNVVDVLGQLLIPARQLAQVHDVNLIASHPLLLQHQTGTEEASQTEEASLVQLQQQQPGQAGMLQSAISAAHPAAVALPHSPTASPTAIPATTTKCSSSSDADSCELLPRPIRPLLVGLAASTCRRILAFVLDVALQCTPRGGQLCVTARQCSGGVQVDMLHTGQVQPGRLHTTSKAFDATWRRNPSLQAMPASPRSGNSAATADGSGSIVSDNSSSSTVRRRSGIQELTGSLRGGCSLVSLDFATELLQNIGGRLTVVYPCHFVNAISGQLEVGSSIEVWLPPPTAA